MSQSTITFSVILFTFLVFVTVKGELPAYMKVFGLKQ
jgi:hypothetical protein